MAFTERIAIIIDAVKDGAVRGLNTTGDAASGMATRTRGANIALSLLNNTGIAHTQVGQRMVAGINQQGTAMGGLKASAGQLGGAMKLAAGAGVAMIAVGIAAFALKGAEQFVKLTAEVRGFQRIAGTTAEDSSRIVALLSRLGISAETGAKAIGMLEKNIGSGKLKLVDWGSEVARTSEGHVDMAKTLGNVAETYQSIEDPVERAKFANAAFGKSWQTLTPLLGKGREEVEKIYKQAEERGLIFDQSDLDKGRELSVAMKDLDQAGEGLGVTLGKDLVPMFTSVIEALTYTADAGQPVLEFFGKLPDVIGDVARGVQTLFTPWDENETKMNKQAKAAEAAALENQEFAESVLAQVNATNQAEQGLAGLTAETEAYVGVALSAEAANRAVTKAIDDQTEATKEASDAGGKNVEANKKSDDAFFRLKQSIHQAAEANKAQAIAAAAGTSEAHKAQVGQMAYADTLAFYSNSSSPAAVLATAQLKNTINSLGGEIAATRFQASIPMKLFLDTAEAQGKLNSLRAEWDAVAGAFGPVGPQGPRR